MTRALDAVFGGSPGAIVESLVFALVFSLLGYRMSVRHRVARGVTPWRLPSAVWALICLVLQFVGIALEILAELTTRPAMPATPPSTDQITAYPYAYAPPAPAAPDVQTLGAEVAVEDEEEAVGPPLGADGRPASFGWYEDPVGRHEMRYFDGRGWTELVGDAGQAGTDPL